jgi:hypothetical protein
MNLKQLFPYCSIRGLAARILFNGLLRSESIYSRINRENIENWKKYKKIKFECNICGFYGTPFFDFPNLSLRREHRIGELRESLHCRKCAASMRDRTLVRQFLEQVSKIKKRQYSLIKNLKEHDLEGIKILDTDAYSSISKYLKKYPNYIRSSFLDPENLNYEMEPNYFNINLEKIGFKSDSFDIVLTSDVMEHVRDIDSAHKEISRILKIGGKYIFTVPYDHSSSTHHILVDTQNDLDHYLVPPQYHGDPISGGIIAYRVFGRAIFSDLKEVQMNLEVEFINDVDHLILNGDSFVATKTLDNNNVY